MASMSSFIALLLSHIPYYVLSVFGILKIRELRREIQNMRKLNK